MAEAWRSFKKDGHWDVDVNVRNFIQTNYTPYDGDESFLEGPTEATDKLWGRLQELQKEEREHNGVLECETEVVSSLTAYGPGYIDESMKDLEQIVGLQTDKPLKRAFMPYGGIKMAQQAASTYGYEVNAKYDKIFNEYHKTHNQAVFDAYTDEMKVARHTHIVTGLPDTYGRGRIVGDYRRVALYGIDFLIQKKEEDKKNCGTGVMTEDIIRLREEIADQIKALKGMKEMAKIYGYDISGPATTAKEAIQWLYFGYLAAIKTQNGAAMSVGRISTFLDIYIERMKGLSPLEKLNQGFSYVEDERHHAVTSIEHVKTDDILRIQVSDGCILSRVTGVQAVSRNDRPGSSDSAQMGQ